MLVLVTVDSSNVDVVSQNEHAWHAAALPSAVVTVNCNKRSWTPVIINIRQRSQWWHRDSCAMHSREFIPTIQL